ncbi:MAG: class I SAM-dependent methyltransferase [Dermatophilus congolensis]|nr:class I SAM-dependent methyltransferase [Dermatophilus congolensis]
MTNSGLTSESGSSAGRGAHAAPTGDLNRANRGWWSSNATEYYDEHGDFLGDTDLVWGPEGVTEPELGLLGELTGRDVLEYGCGAAQGARYVRSRGARAVGLDLAEGMLRVGRDLDARHRVSTPLVHGDAAALPFADSSFDIVFSAYGATAFVADLPDLVAGCARVLRPGGRLVYSTSHPIRWAFPDGPTSLTATMSYFDRAPYTETRGGRLDYAECHHTIGDHVRAVAEADLRLLDLVEPEWPEHNTSTWGGWSPLRGRHIPGTLIVVAEKS